MRDNVSFDVKDLIDTLVTHKGDIVLYGAGLFGKKTYNILHSAGIPVSAFCDADPAKIGTVYMTKPVISTEQLKQMDDYVVIISVTQKNQNFICESLVQMGIKNIFAVSLPQANISSFVFVMPAEQVIIDVDDVQVKKYAYQQLHDSMSQKIYVAWLYFSLTKDKTAYEWLDSKYAESVFETMINSDLTEMICSFEDSADGKVVLCINDGEFLVRGLHG